MKKLPVCCLSLAFFCACTPLAGGRLLQDLTPTATVIPAADIAVCASGCDFTSIQDAIDAPATAAGAVIAVLDTIHTEAGILVSKDVTIQGLGQTATILQAAESATQAHDRIFFIPAGVQVVIRHMTLRYGNPQADIRSGGAIRNEGTLLLENIILRENEASAGGAILNDGTLHISNSTITENIAKGGGDIFTECKTGGGIKIMGGAVTIENSTISGNQSKGKGGGIHIACVGELYATNTTISGNTSLEDGGGVYINGLAYLTHVTITENTSTNGGGIAIQGSGEKGVIRGQLNYQNTIVANNHIRLEDYGTVECLAGRNAEIVLNQNNWVADGNCEASYSGDPLLLALSDNGGYSLTHLLSEDSPAQNVLAKEDCLLECDQRGYPRTSPCGLGATESK
ncbi:MAG TPA: hypothetical protein DCK95_09875 [Anaerolineaceae bacterium]|nr:hypothetical protein [Anaerolineaceae bacterium]